MYFPGVVAGLLALFTVASLVGGATHNAAAGFFPGLVAAIWAAWPLFHRHSVQRDNFLHPPPRRYNASTNVAFGKVRHLLREMAYNFGDKWHVATADVATNRIFAELRFFDEETHTDVSSRGQVHVRKERVKRYLSLEVQMKDEAKGMSIVQYDFDTRIEGTRYGACDNIIAGLMDSLERELGPSTDVGHAASQALPAPPWWLLSITAVSLAILFQDVLKVNL